MQYGNNFGNPQPSNNLWVGNNYSSGYRNGFQNQNPQMMNNNNNNNRINNIFQVMGLEGALAYQIGPDSKVILMDTNRPVFYIKQSDSGGYSETEAYEFHKIPLMPEQSTATSTATSTAQINPEEYVTKNEFNEFKQMIEELMKDD